LLFNSVILAEGINIKLGYNIDQKFKVSASNETNSISINNGVNPNFTLICDADFEITDMLSAGGGIEMMTPTSLKNENGDFLFMSIYPLIKFNIGNDYIKYYNTLKIGYNFFIADSTFKSGNSLGNGIFFGINAGVLFGKVFSIDFNYSQNRGTLTNSIYKADITLTKYMLTAGFNIPF